jgi:hypothetical protein
MKPTFAVALAALACAVTPLPLQAQTILFADTFDRPDGTDLNASSEGKSGTLGALSWVQKGVGGGSEILGNQLKAGDNGAGAGWAFAYIDRNFADAAIASAGGFSVSIDMVAYATAGATRHMALAVGMSKAEAEGWAHNVPASLTYVDLFVGYRGNQSAIQVFDNGVQIANNTSAGAPATLPKTLVVDFSFSSFTAGSSVNYKATFGGVEMAAGSFAWSGTDENYIGIYTNLTTRQARMDNFAIQANTVTEPLTLKIAQSGGKLDFEWNSQAGVQYDLLSSTDLSTGPATWLPYNDGVTTHQNIPSFGTGTNNLSGVLKVGPARFFALRQESIPPLLSADFELDNGGFTAGTTQGTAWAWGDPDSTGPGGSVTTGAGTPPSTNCWGTGIGNPGYYADPTATALRSPIINLTGVAAAQLTFAQALDLEAGDSAQVYLIDDTTDAEIAGPIHASTDANPSEANWGTVGPVAIPAAALGQPVRIEWRFSGFGGATNDYTGWYIDNVTVSRVAP